MKKSILALLAVLIGGPLFALSEVPEKLQYCGIELSIDADVRASLTESVAKIKRSDVYFQSLVDRANIYFPFVEEAFDLRGVPHDLKYIIIMESSFVSDAVSSSNAVGFWQFKDQSAKESGIVIDDFVDERKHIFQSSLGAAKYFYTIARYFDNYLYAVVGYNRGPVGALPFIVTDDLGSRKVHITKETHWYALKAIAYKLAFEDAVGKTDPPMWLQPMTTNGETDVTKLAAEAKLTLEEFKKYNTWIKGGTLPEGRSFVYYLPRQGKQELTLLKQVRGGKQIGGGTPVKVEEKPTKAIEQPKLQTRDTKKFIYLEPGDDIDYGAEYVRVKQGESLVEIAVRYNLKPKKLKEINAFSNSYRPQTDDFVYLKAAKSRKYHIVQAGETLHQIAERYATTEDKLRDKNRMTGSNIYAGQKLSLKKKIAKDAKPTLVVVPMKVEAAPIVEVKETKVEKPKVASNAGVISDDPSSYLLTAFESKWVTHTVVQGESVWKIAKKYGAFAEVVKKINGLTTNEVKPGTQLKILQVTDKK